MNTDLTVFALRTAAEALEVLRAKSINPYAIAHLIDKTAQELRKPTDDELLAVANLLDQKLNSVFGAAPGGEPNDVGPRDEH